MGWPLPPAKRAEHERIVAATREALGEVAFDAAWIRGHSLPLKEVIADPLSDGE
jgi:hypothetical protein